MILRRWPMLAVVVVAFAAAGVLGRTPEPPPTPVFSEAATPWMPAVQPAGEDDATFGSTWFCPGVFAAGATGTAGEIVLVNPTDTVLRAVITAYGATPAPAEPAPDTTTGAAETGTTETGTAGEPAASGEPVTRTVDVPARSLHRQDVAELLVGEFVATMVEFDRVGGFVEQVATAPVSSSSEARSIGACTTAPSSNWYFAAGNTDGTSTDIIVISNPYDHSAVVDLRIDSPRGPRQIGDAMPIPAHSVRTVELTNVIADQPWVGVSINATRGSVVAGRSQLFATDELSGYAMTLGAPTLSSYWWFAFGVQADNVSTRFLVYNPGDKTVTITPAPVGVPLAGTTVIESIDIPGHTVYELDPSQIEAIGEGAYSMVITTAESDQRVVVERQSTRRISGVPTTSLTMGGLNRPDGSHSSRWYIGVPFEEEVIGGLQLLNAGGDGTVSVLAVRPEGLVPVAGLTDVAVVGAALQQLDITDPAALGVPLIVTADFPMIVERLLPRESNAQGRVAVWAVPSAV